MKKCLRNSAFVFILLCTFVLVGCVKQNNTVVANTTNAITSADGQPVVVDDDSIYVVSFNSNGGSEVLNQSVDSSKNFTLTKPTDPTKEGAGFVAWYSDEALTSVWDFSSKVSQNMTLYAKWSTDEYTVSFRTFIDGKTITSQSVMHGGLVEKPEDIENNGFEIANWYVGDNTSNVWDFTTSKVTGDITLSINWQRSRYNVELSAEDATNDYTKNVTVTYQVNQTISTVPVRDGFVFLGYYSSEAGGVKYFDYNGYSSATIDSDIKLYARWTEKTYTVYLNMQGGSNYYNVTSANVAVGSDYLTRIYNPTKSGYTFLGWYENTSTGKMVIDKAGKLIADTSYTDEFGFWSYEGNPTVYAKWQNNVYDIVLKNTDATVVGSLGVEVTYYSSALPVITNPTKEGKAFLGWYYEDELIIDYTGKLVASTRFTDSNCRWIYTYGATLECKWGEANNTLSFNSNGATSVGTESVLVTVGGGLLSSITNPTRNYYSFQGWFIEDKKIINANGELLSCVPYTNIEGKWIYGEDIELTAKWQAQRSRVSINQNGTTIAGSTMMIFEYMGEKSLVDIVNPERNGYIFQGWSYGSSSSSKITIDTEGNLVPNVANYTNEEGKWICTYNSLSFYARWAINNAGTTITLDNNGATTNGSESLAASYNSILPVITNPVKEGNEFYGWADEEGTLVIDRNGKLIANNKYASSNARWYYCGTTLTLYAQYVEKIVTATTALDGGLNGSTTIEISMNGDILSVITNPTKTGYNFLGWYYEDELIIDVDKKLVADTSYTNESAKWIEENNVSLVAKWEVKDITITLDNTLANVIGTTSIEVSYMGDITTNIVNPERIGYTFIGWAVGTSTTAKVTIDVDGNLLPNISPYTNAAGKWVYDGLPYLYAKWEARVYSIILDNNGATTPGYSSAKIAWGSSVLAYTGDALPVKDGYEFMGWYSEKDELIISTTGLVNISEYTYNGYWLTYDNVTLTAKWNKVCTITFDDNEATTLGYTSATVTQGKNNLVFTGLNNPEKTNYTFLGWYSENDELIIDLNNEFIRNTEYTDIYGCYSYNNNVTLYAKWQALGNIILSTEEGTLQSTNAKVALNSNEISEIENPIRNDYAFMGWYHNEEMIISIDGSLNSNTTYTDASGCWLGTEEVTLTASWKEATADLVYTNVLDAEENIIGYSVSEGEVTETDIIIPDYHNDLPIISLKANAFTKATIISLYIPYTVETIESGALNGCSNIVSLTVPFVGASRTTTGYRYAFGYIFGTTAFSNTTNISQRYFYSNNDNYTTSTTYRIPISLKEITVTDIETLNYGSFYGMNQITKVSLPNSVKNIGNYVFYNCQALKNVNIPYNVTVLGDYSFYTCKALEEVILPQGLLVIGSYCFYYCSSMTKITIPDKLKTIYSYAFYYCQKLSEVYVSDLHKWMSIDFMSDTSNPLYYNSNNPAKGETLYVYNKSSDKYDAITDLVIPEDITVIKPYTFTNNTSITSVTFHENITKIGANAFRECTGLKNIYIDDINKWAEITFENYYSNPLSSYRVFKVKNDETGEYDELSTLKLSEDVTKISAYAFYNSSNIREFYITDNIETIGQQAFYNCSYLNSIKCSYDAKLREIGMSAFANDNIATIYLPNNIEKIESNAFAKTYSSNSIIYIDDIDNYSQIEFVDQKSSPSGSYNSRLYIFNEETGKDELAENILFGNIDYISPYAFINYYNIKTITIPDSVKYIGDYAFMKNTALTTVNISEDSLLNRIGDYAFSNCNKLTSIFLPDSLVSIGIMGFAYCTKLAGITLPENLEILSSNAFEGCYELVNITIPKSINNLGNEVFVGCSKLESITFESGNEIKYIPVGLVKNCISLTSVALPEKLIGIGSSSFYGCSKLSEIEISEGITRIESNAFRGCTKLAGITLPSTLQTIYQYAFESCYSIKEIFIPKSVITIDTCAFQNCTGLLNVTFESGINLTYINSSVFYNCSNIVEIAIPYGVTSIGSRAFAYNTRLAKLYIPVTVTSIYVDAFIGCDMLVQIQNNTNYDLTNCGLKENKNREVIVDGEEFTSTVTTDENGVVIFETENSKSIIGYVGNNEVLDLTSYTDVSSIYESAFKNCTIMKKIIVPNNIESIGFGAFSGCTSIEEMVLPYVGFSKYATGEKALFGYIFGNVSFAESYYTRQYYSDSSNLVYYLPYSLVKVDIMNDDYLSYGAFSNCSKIETININSEISSIGEKVFYNCEGLRSFDLSNIELMEINKELFYSCKNLTSVILPDSITKINKSAFMYCQSLETIILPSGLKEIAEYAFAYCTNLSSIELPDSLEILGEYAFEGTAITEITIPEKITVIKGNTFYKCFYLETVNFASDSNLKEIEYYAFGYCYSLKTINLPSSLEILDNSVFYYCYNLCEVAIPDKVEEIESNTFAYCFALNSITIPNNVKLVDSYAFYNCYNLYQITNLSEANVSFSGANAKLEIIGDGEEFVNELTTENGVVLLIDYMSNETNPITYIVGYKGNSETIDLTDCSGTIIEPYAFFMKNVSTIIVPNTVTEIGYSAFGGCYKLETLTLPFVGNNVDAKNTEDALFGYVFGNESISDFYSYFSSYSQCYNSSSYGRTWYVPYSLKNVSITDAKEISYGAFSYIYAENVYLNCTEIGEKAFYSAYNSRYVGDDYIYYGIKHITLSKNVKKICDQAFYYARLLESVTFESGSELEYIGYEAFYYCYNSNSTDEGLETYGLKSITIPKSVKYIGERAFYYCCFLESVIFESGSELERIEDYTFYDCYYSNSSDGKLEKYGLKSITIPKSVKYIGESAFKYCEFLESLTFEAGSNLEYIGEFAFASCSYSYSIDEIYGISRIELPESLKKIGDYAFSNNSNLANISIPSSIEEIGPNCFNYCEKLVFHNEGNINYLGNANNKYVVAFSVSDETKEEYVINDNAKNIMPNIFAKCVNVKKITVPFIGINYNSNLDSYSPLGSFFNRYNDTTGKYIEVEQAYSMSGSQNYYIPKGLNTVIVTKATQIPYGAFSNCSFLTKIVLPETVEIVGGKAFENCSDELDIYTTSNNITYIGNEENLYLVAYEVSNKELESYTLNANTKVIAGELFASCELLSFITIPNGVISIGNAAFANCSNLSSLILPQSIKYIGDSAFAGCSSLSSITLPSGLKEIGVGAFAETAITSIQIPKSIKIINQGAFCDCKKLATVEFAANSELEVIKESAFSGCLLTNFTLPLGLKEIAASAFSGSGITSINLPSSVETIGEVAFAGCANLKTFTIADNSMLTEIANGLFSNSGLETIEFGENSILNRIGFSAFSPSKLSGIVIPASVSIIESGAFASCGEFTSIVFEDNSQIEIINSGLFAGNAVLKTVDFGENSSLKEISGGAFNSTGISSITIPKTVVKLGMAVFANCASLSQITFEEGSKLNYVDSNCFASTAITSIVIPKNVTTLTSPFSGCTSLKTVKFEDESKIMGLYSSLFAGLSALESVDFGKNSRISFINDYVFSGTKITSLTIPATVNSLYSNAFSGCYELKEVIFESCNLYSISSNTFANLAKLEKVDFGKNCRIVSIYESAFISSGIKTITIPKTVININDYAFMNCTSLTSVIFEEGSMCSYIGAGAFSGCTSLTSISLPEKISSIGKNAFDGCSALESITFDNENAIWEFSSTSDYAESEEFDVKDASENATLFTETLIDKYARKAQYILQLKAYWDDQLLTNSFYYEEGDYSIQTLTCYSNTTIEVLEETFVIDNGNIYTIQIPVISGYTFDSITDDEGNEITSINKDTVLKVNYTKD